MSEETPTTETPEAATARPLSLLAAERFGASYHGEVPEEPEQPEEAPVEASEEPAGEPSEPSEVEEPESDEVPISSIRELIEHNEYDPEWFNTLKVPVKVDGQEGEATVDDLVRSYQTQQAAEKRLEDAKTKAKALNQELAEKSEALQGQFAITAKLIENAEKLVDQETASIDWKKLREDDPAEYSARKADVAERRKQVEEMKREAVEAFKQTVEKHKAEIQEQRKSRLQAEYATLVEKLPDWRDAEKAKAEQAKLTEFLLKEGFSEQDVMGASDHRLILLARKAMLYDASQANTQVAKKKLAKVPKVLKPGAPKPQDQINREKVDKLRAKAAQSGKLDDAFALLKARRGGV